MKVAIAADGRDVSPHFGRCEKYELAEVSDGRVVARETIANHGHEHGMCSAPDRLHQLGADCVVCGGAGPRAVAALEQLGLRVLSGVSGPVETVLEALASGDLEAGASTCNQGARECGPCD